MLKFGICDDVPAELNKLKNLIDLYCAEHNIAAEIYTWLDGTELLKKTSTIKELNIIFLDIKMPHVNGIDLGRILSKDNPHLKIIYLTAYIDFIELAVNEAHCFFYLSKPIDYKILTKKLDIAIKYMQPQDHKIELIADKTKYYCNLDDIFYFERIRRKTHVILMNSKLEIYTSLNELETRLSGYAFAMPHRSYLINLKYIYSIGNSTITMSNNQKISMAQRKSIEFKIAYNRYLQSCLIY